MGRQYNYYIGPQEDINPTKAIQDAGFQVLYLNKHQNNVYKFERIDTRNNKFSMPCKTYIYNGEWEQLLESTSIYEAERKNMIIEQIHCILNKESSRLSRGRIYFDTQPYYEDKEKFEIIYKDFQKIVRLVKKNIVYKSYDFSDGQWSGWSLSQTAVDLIESGYKLGY